MSLANKSTAQFKRIQFELGYSDDISPKDDLSKKQLDTLAKKLGEKTMNRLKDDITSNEQTARGLRKGIVGTSHEIQGAMQRRAAVPAGEAKTKAEEEKTAIDETIKAVKEVAEAVGSVISAISFAVRRAGSNHSHR